MKLLSITVRHYRIVREATIALAPGLTLIGGPNEAGKSTLMEAAHRGLFLRARSTGKLRDAMMSHGGTEHPQVEMTFQAQGATWRLAKKFAGPSGQCTLTREGGESWQGDAAEERLAEVLGTSVPAGRAGIAVVTGQWAHLWIWQGESGSDPTAQANEHKAALLSKLDETNGSVAAQGSVASVLQSPLDAALSARFHQRHDALFKKSGDPRSDSPLGLAEDVWTQARAAVAAAQERCDRLAHSAAAMVGAHRDLERAVADEAVITPEWQRVQIALQRVAELRAIESRHVVESDGARRDHDRLAAAEAQIAQCHDEVLRLREAIAPAELEADDLARRETESVARLESAEAERQQAAAARAATQHRHDLLTARISQLEKSAMAAQCHERQQAVAALSEEDRRLGLELAGLPAVDAAVIQQLTVLERARDEAAAAMRGMAASVRVVASDRDVQVDGQPLRVGAEHVVFATAEIMVGDGVKLTLTPGGGSVLEDASLQRIAAQQSLDDQLSRLGLASVAAAAETAEHRRHLENTRDTVRARLADYDADHVAGQLKAATEAAATAEAAVARLLAAPAANDDDLTLPAALADAQREVIGAAHALAVARTREDAATAARSLAENALADIRRHRTAHAATVSTRRTELTAAVARHEILVSSHGDTATRHLALAAAAATLASTAATLAATRAELTTLQPEQLESDRDRLQRSLAQVADRQRSAEMARAVARNELTRDGGDDPHGWLAQMIARELAARESMASARREADAVRLLHHLFTDEQRSLADRLTRPFADAINGYLRCLFGPQAEAIIRYDNQHFGSLALVRPDHLAGAIPFSALSGGTREQVATAMRLAMAEVLAADHHGSLPIVFDDAFAYADPTRIRSLQRMLDLAARRGLQVIVLTCTPAEYAGLGAHLVSLESFPR